MSSKAIDDEAALFCSRNFCGTEFLFDGKRCKHGDVSGSMFCRSNNMIAVVREAQKILRNMNNLGSARMLMKGVRSRDAGKGVGGI
jgi:hypothetical protein